MKINNFLKIALFSIGASLLFTSCAHKTPNKKVAEIKAKNMNDILNDSKLFEYDAKQRLYKNKFTQEQNRKDLLLKFAEFCTNKKGKLVYIDYFINKDYVNSYSGNKAYICEIEGIPYYIGHIAKQNTNNYLSISIDERTKKEYLNKQKAFERAQASSSLSNFDVTPTTQISGDEAKREREEIQRRERAREQKAKLLLNKSQTTMTFFDTWRQTGKDSLCATKCKSINKKNTGFTTLNDATATKWQIVSKDGQTSQIVDETCTCIGSSVTLKKLSNEESK